MNTCSFCWLDPAGASCDNSFRRDKMVKYIRAIEFSEDYKTIGKGQGGWREDYRYFSQEAGM